MEAIRQKLRDAIAFALPPRCPGCGAIQEADHRLCATCWTGLDFIGKPGCERCNTPFEFDRGEGAWCGPCLAKTPLHDGIHAAIAYGDVASGLMLRLKYGRRTAYAETAARLMARVVPTGFDVAIPVPLHRSRLWSRGFNQAALLAEGLSRHVGVPVERQALRRIRRTPVLRGLGPAARQKVLAGAFAVDPRYREVVAGRAVLLVDDVYTSGATSDACIRVLKREGAASVAVAAFARVLPDTGGD